MLFRIIRIDNGKENVVSMSEKSAADLGIFFGDLVQLKIGQNKVDVFIVEDSLPMHTLAVSKSFSKVYGLGIDKSVSISPARAPESVRYIFKKIQGKPLSQQEINMIVNDVDSRALSEAAIAYFVTAVAKNGLSLKETYYLTKAMASSGEKLKLGSGIIADKHCVGGIPGNRTTPIVVSICAAAGVVMPKTSSRAITSAAGTADVMEVLTNVTLPPDKIKYIVRKTGACLVLGGSLGLAPADDLLIRIERQINMDPTEQIVASILSKKIAAGSTHVLIDIPIGNGAKVSLKEGKVLEKLFKSISSKFNIKVEVVLTDGTKPIGNGLGPVLEAIDVLNVLERKEKGSNLEAKSVFLAGKILELSNKVKKGNGMKLAQKILDSGAALDKFNEIIEAQGKKYPSLQPGPYKFNLFSAAGKKIRWNNQNLNHLARALGCPEKKHAGILLHVQSGMKPSQGKPILTLYSETQEGLEQGKEFLKKNSPFNFI